MNGGLGSTDFCRLVEHAGRVYCRLLIIPLAALVSLLVYLLVSWFFFG